MFFVRIWILTSACVVGMGWVLSIFGELNRAGYVVAALLCLGTGWWRGRGRFASWLADGQRGIYRLGRRFRRFAPQAFGVLAGLALLAGILYSPTTREESQYRTPRVLHWLAEGHWHWIRTFDVRMNIAGCGFEWLTAPLLLFAHTDRLVFLVNFVSFLLLPGLVFSLLRHLKIAGRVAWWWMWLLPGAFCYALQAGTAANDAFATIYALAAVCFALRARTTGADCDLWLSMLAAGLLTGSKQTNLPLAALWIIAVWPALGRFRARFLPSLAVAVCAALVSALPLIWLNWTHDRTWSGVPLHPGLDWTFRWEKIALTSPVWGVIGNAFCIPLQNLAPPFFPTYEAWNRLLQQFTHTPAGSNFLQFEDFGHLSAFQAPESGLGLFLCLFLLSNLLWGWLRGRKPAKRSVRQMVPEKIILGLRFTPWLLLLIFMANVGAYQNARQLAPYYVFLMPLLLALPQFSWLVRRRSWQALALGTMAATAGIMVMSPTAPLFPAQSALRALARHHPQSRAVLRLESFYSTPAISRAMRHVFANRLPSAGTIGYATEIEGLEPGLWHPFTRRVERVLPEDTLADLTRRGVRYIVVDTFFLDATGCHLDQLLARYHARAVDQALFSRGWNRPPDPVYLIRLPDFV